MNPVSFYTRQKESWSEDELQQVRSEYEEKHLSISQIADLHRRTPGSISYKLKNLGIIAANTEARGYTEYKNSALYKEIVQSGKRGDTTKRKERLERATQPRLQLTSPLIQTDGLSRELLIMKNDIASLKNDVKEILHLIHSIYEFEST